MLSQKRHPRRGLYVVVCHTSRLRCTARLPRFHSPLLVGSLLLILTSTRGQTRGVISFIELNCSLRQDHPISPRTIFYFTSPPVRQIYVVVFRAVDGAFGASIPRAMACFRRFLACSRKEMAGNYKELAFGLYKLDLATSNYSSFPPGNSNLLIFYCLPLNKM